MKYEGIDKAIKEGYKLHVFLSGGGLRVCRLENYKGEYKNRNYVKNELIAYGEHINLKPALEKVNKNYYERAEYKTEYYTGNSNPDSELDKMVLRGYDIDIVPAVEANTLKVLKVVKAGDVLGDRTVIEKAVTIIVRGCSEEFIRIIASNVDEALASAEQAAKFINESTISPV